MNLIHRSAAWEKRLSAAIKSSNRRKHLFCTLLEVMELLIAEAPVMRGTTAQILPDNVAQPLQGEPEDLF